MTPIIPRWKHIPRDTSAGYTARVSPDLHSLDANFPFGLDYYLLLKGVDIFILKSLGLVRRPQAVEIGIPKNPFVDHFRFAFFHPSELGDVLMGFAKRNLANLLFSGHWCSLNFLVPIYKLFLIFSKLHHFELNLPVKGGDCIESNALFKIKPSDAFFLSKVGGNTFFVRNAARSQKNSQKWKISSVSQERYCSYRKKTCEYRHFFNYWSIYIVRTKNICIFQTENLITRGK